LTLNKISCEEYITKLFNTYKLVSVLANRNDCKTLRLRHKEIGRDIVLHKLPKHNEIYELLLNIRCKYLPEVYEVINLSDGQIVLEEYIDGLTVAQVMESGRYHRRGAKKVLKSVCFALSFLHNHNFVHRDIKPENIMVSTSGRIVLIDFNTTRSETPARKDTNVMGTAGYASPEQIGISKSDSRTDIDAAGVLLCVMLTGQHPSEKIPSGKMGRVIKKCTNINPRDRYQSAEELQSAL